MELQEKIRLAREIYMQEKVSLADAAERAGIPAKTIFHISAAEGWAKLKKPPGPLEDPAEYRRIHEKYMRGDMSLPQLAREEDIPVNKLRARAGREHWSAEREEYRAANGLAPINPGPPDKDEQAVIEAVREAYLAGEGSLRELTEKYGARQSQIKCRSAKENWPQLRAAGGGRGRKPVEHKYDLTAIETDYISCETEPEEFAGKYGMTPMLLRHYIYKGNWDEKRIAYRKEVQERLQEHIRNGTPPPDMESSEDEAEKIAEQTTNGTQKPDDLSRTFNDYGAVRAEYVTGNARLWELSEKYNISHSTIRWLSCREHWVQQRREYRKAREAMKLEANLKSEVAYQLEVRKRMASVLEGVDETVADIRKRIGTPEEWKTIVEVMSNAEAVDRRTAGKLTAMEERKLQLEQEMIDLRKEKQDDEYELAQKRMCLNEKILREKQRDEHEEYALRRRKVELAEKIEAEKHAPPKPIPIYWGDPRMEECAK